MRTKIEQVAREMAADIGLINITRAELCRRVGIPEGSFHREMGGLSFVDFVEGLEIRGTFSGSSLVTRTRAIPALRRENILAAAVQVAVERGYGRTTRNQVAEAAGVSAPLVTKYFRNMDRLREAIIREAVRTGVLPVVAQGIVAGDPVAKAAPAEMKARAAAWMKNN